MTKISKQESAYAILRERIEHSEYAASQRLVIDSIAKELNMSQVPIREAIRRLEAEGLVLYSANSGPVVATFSADQWSQLMMVLAVLEGYATAEAAQHITPKDLVTLRKTNKDMGDALEKLQLNEWTAKNRLFHRIINDRCRNEVLIDRIKHTQIQVDMMSRIVFAREGGVIIHTLGPRIAKATLKAHEDIVAAIESKASSARIEKLIRDHVMEPVRQVQRANEGKASGR